MIRSLAKKAAIFAALLGIATAGWACGLTGVDPMQNDEHSAAAGNTSSMPDHPMKDCGGNETSKSSITPPCVALCAITVNVTPVMSPAVAVQIGEPHYPAGPAIRNWLIQPEPYPPRA